MGKECKRILEDLLDVFYQERPMAAELEIHLKSCDACKVYLESLHALRQDFSILASDVAIDHEEIRQAFQTAEVRKKKRKDGFDFIIFLVLIFAVMLLFMGSVALGYGMVILICQVSIASLTSLLVPLLFIKKMRKEINGYE